MKEEIEYSFDGIKYLLKLVDYPGTKSSTASSHTELGYDVYKEDEDDPVNLGEIAYFDNEPTEEEFVEWLLRGGIKGKIKMEEKEEKQISLLGGQIIITDPKDDWAKICSTLHTDLMDEEDTEYNAAIDAIESLVLGHYCAGVDVEDSKYLEGLQTAIDACSNNS